jgi:hypothetical protein
MVIVKGYAYLHCTVRRKWAELGPAIPLSASQEYLPPSPGEYKELTSRLLDTTTTTTAS